MTQSYRPEYRNEVRIVRTVESAVREDARRPARRPSRLFLPLVLATALIAGLIVLNLALRGAGDNRRPAAELEADRPVIFAGEAVVFDGSGSSDPDGTVAVFGWQFADGAPPLETRAGLVTHTYRSAGVFNASLRVEDDRGASSATARTTVVVVARPAASALSALTFDPITFSVDRPGAGAEEVRLEWSFSDGAPHESGAAVGHFFRDGGTWMATVEASCRGGSANASVSVNISNRPPLSYFNFPDAGPSWTNQEVIFNGSEASDRDGSIAEWKWDFGDNTTDDYSGAVARHSYNRSGVFKVTLTVTDDDRANSSMTRELPVFKDMLVTRVDISTYVDSEGVIRADLTVRFDNSGDPKEAGLVRAVATAYTPGQNPILPESESTRAECCNEPVPSGARGLSLRLFGLLIYARDPDTTWYYVELIYNGTAVDSGWYQKHS